MEDKVKNYRKLFETFHHSFVLSTRKLGALNFKMISIDRYIILNFPTALDSGNFKFFF